MKTMLKKTKAASVKKCSTRLSRPSGPFRHPVIHLFELIESFSKQMEMARKRKHTEHAIGLIVEQLEYLKTELANAKKGGVVDSEGRLRIDR